MNAHQVIRTLNLNLNNGAKNERLYGTCDPVPNASEMILAGLLAGHNPDKGKKEATFLTYNAGPTSYVDQTYQESKKGLSGVAPLTLNASVNKIEKWLGCRFCLIPLENIIKKTGLADLKLGEFIKNVSSLRDNNGQYKVFHIPSFGFNDIYNQQQNLGKLRDMTVYELHENGGWLSGTGIHFVLRVFADENPCVLIAPWNDKGDVFYVYSGSGASFLLCPSLYLIPKNSSHWGNTVHIQWFGGLLDLWKKKRIDSACLGTIKNQFFRTRKWRIIFEVSEEGINLI